MTKSFGKDKLWQKVKNASKSFGFESEWLKIISFYNLYDGKHVQVYVVDKETKESFRVLGVADQDNQVITLDKNNQVKLFKDYKLADSMKKSFIYNSEPSKQVKLSLDKLTVNQNAYLKYYI